MSPKPYRAEDRFTAERIEEVKRRRYRLAGRIAMEFSQLLHHELGNDIMSDIVCRNVLERNEVVCHTHDFIDANETMIEAFVNVGMDVPDPQNDDTCLLWDMAWDMAKKAKFNVGNLKLYSESI